MSIYSLPNILKAVEAHAETGIVSYSSISVGFQSPAELEAIVGVDYDAVLFGTLNCSAPYNPDDADAYLEDDFYGHTGFFPLFKMRTRAAEVMTYHNVLFQWYQKPLNRLTAYYQFTGIKCKLVV